MDSLTIRPPAITDGISFACLILLMVGIALRRDRSKHPKIMVAAFVLDLGLVLYLELTRGAIDRASQLASQILTIHVGFAVATLVFNVALLVTGYRIYSGKSAGLTTHRRLAWVFMICRIATFLTAFVIPAR